MKEVPGMRNNGPTTAICPKCGGLSAVGCMDDGCKFPYAWIVMPASEREKIFSSLRQMADHIDSMRVPITEEPDHSYQEGYKAGVLAMRAAAVQWHEGRIGQLLADHRAQTHGIQAAVHKSSAEAIRAIDLKGGR